MKVLLRTEFAASRKEPLGEMAERVWAAFERAGMGAPEVGFNLADSPVGDGVSIVKRVLKRFPAMERFLEEARLPFADPSAAPIACLRGKAQMAELREILAGVPRSFPFHGIVLTFRAPELGEDLHLGPIGEVKPGVAIGDSWWVTGRSRSLSAMVFVEAEKAGKKLPPLPVAVAELYAGLGKAKKTLQTPMPGEHPALPSAAKPEVLEAVGRVVAEYRARMPEILGSVGFPHDLPPSLEARQATGLGQATGPKKPALREVFGAMGYDSHGESGVFTLKKRTAINHTLEISLDVGTWSRSLTASFCIHGLGFRSLLQLPVSARSGAGQYPIGDGENWRRMVENLGVLVAELERSFVPAVEAAAGASPEWFQSP